MLWYALIQILIVFMVKAVQMLHHVQMYKYRNSSENVRFSINPFVAAAAVATRFYLQSYIFHLVVLIFHCTKSCNLFSFLHIYMNTHTHTYTTAYLFHSAIVFTVHRNLLFYAFWLFILKLLCSVKFNFNYSFEWLLFWIEDKCHGYTTYLKKWTTTEHPESEGEREK